MKRAVRPELSRLPLRRELTTAGPGALLQRLVTMRYANEIVRKLRKLG